MSPTRKSPGQLAQQVREGFRESGKRSLLITGSKGVGKITLLEHLCAGRAFPGVRSWAERAADGTACTVWLQDRAIGRCAAVRRWQQGRSIPVPRRLKRWACRRSARRLWLRANGRWWDETGFLEQQCPEYCAALHSLFNARRVIAVLRKQGSPLRQALLSRSDIWFVDLGDQFPPSAGA